MEVLVVVKSIARQIFWKNKKVLITGHTGFKGAWLTFWLNHLGAKITGVALEPYTQPNLFNLLRIDSICDSHILDIRNYEQLEEIVKTSSPEIVFHLAAQPLVRTSYDQPLETFTTNIIGTANILNAIRFSDSTKVGIMITTDKVYKNNEWRWQYRETDQLGGYDPYSCSKAAAELVIDGYTNSFLEGQGIAISSARAGNIIGGGDWSLDRLIPDAVRAWSSEKNTLEIRRPNATRPWQHVLEPLSGYMKLAELTWESPSISGAYNFGPLTNSNATVKEIIELARKHYGRGEIAIIEDYSGPHEAANLELDISKAISTLSWRPKFTLSQAVNLSMNWYRAFFKGEPAENLCINDIELFEKEI